MSLQVSLVTPDKDLLHGQVDQVTAPSVNGEVGILPDHLPLLADLEEGVVGLFKSGERESFAVSGGFVEVSNNVVTILAETAEKASDIDVKRSQKALKEAQTLLKSLDPTDADYTEQQARIRRAQVRLQAAGASAE